MLKKTDRYRQWFIPCLLALAILLLPSLCFAQGYKPDLYALSDNGQRLAVLDNGMQRLRLFNAANKQLLWEMPLSALLPQPDGQDNQLPKSLAISPGGRAIYLETPSGVSLLSADKGELFQVYRGMHPRQFALADAASGTILAAYLDVTDSQISSTSLIFHNASSGTVLARADKVIRSFYLHPSGALASYRGQYEQPVIMNLFGARESSLEVDAVASAISDSGKLVLVNDRYFYDRLLYTKNGSQIGQEKRLPKYHHAFFSPDEKFLLLDCQTEILVYNTAAFEHVVSIGKTPIKVAFNAKGELESVTPRYPLDLLRSLAPEYQHQMDKDFNALQNSDAAADKFAFLAEYGAPVFNRHYPLRREMLEHVTQTLFNSLLAKKDSATLLKLASSGYLSAADTRKAIDVTLENYAQAPDLALLREFMQIKQASETQLNKAGQMLFNLVEQQKNIEGQRWFVEQYPATGAALQAADKFCSSLYAEVSGINSLEAYNDFILICPYSAMLPEAARLAGELDAERSKPGFFSNRDQRARELAARITGLTEKYAARGNEWSTLIINRMVEMQKEMFGSRPATAKLLEAPEVIKAVRASARCASKIEKAVKELGAPGSKAASLLRAQAKLTRSHFENGAEDKALQNLYDTSLQSWNKVLNKK